MDTFKGLPVRGLHIDLKAQTMKHKALCTIIGDAARWGYNTILIEYQDKFPFSGNLAEIAAPDALTRDEVNDLLDRCAALDLEVIPLIQCLGHNHHILMHDNFAHLGEDKGDYPAMHALCPSHPESLELFDQMMTQVLQLHTGCRSIHIGGDEARLSPRCPACGDTGKGRLLADYYEQVVTLVQKKNLMPILWSDMVLSHLEALDRLRGRVILMHWDYQETGERLQKTRLYGLDVNQPRSWPEPFQKLRPYVYAIEPYLTKPFPYVAFLRDQGFLVLVAPAARSSGDPCFLPRSLHQRNCLQAVYSAAEANALGVVVTSWSLRRVPWPLTEKILIATAMAMQNPAVSESEIDAAFTREHFNLSDRELAAIPDKLGDAAELAAACVDLYTAGMTYPLGDIGAADDYATRRRARQQVWLGNQQGLIAYRQMKTVALQAGLLLQRAQPATERQKYRLALWQWAVDTALFFADYVPLIINDKPDAEQINQMRQRLLQLRARNTSLMSELLTPDSLTSDDQTRVGIHLQHLDVYQAL